MVLISMHVTLLQSDLAASSPVDLKTAILDCLFAKRETTEIKGCTNEELMLYTKQIALANKLARNKAFKDVSKAMIITAVRDLRVQGKIRTELVDLDRTMKPQQLHFLIDKHLKQYKIDKRVKKCSDCPLVKIKDDIYKCRIGNRILSTINAQINVDKQCELRDKQYQVFVHLHV